MQSISDTIFMMKHKFYEKTIPQYSKVRIITVINKTYLVEDLKTNNREWVMEYEIYPLNNHYISGHWIHSPYYEDIAIKNNLK